MRSITPCLWHDDTALYFGNAIILKYANTGYGNDAGIGTALSGAFSRLLPALGASVLLAVFLLLAGCSKGDQQDSWKPGELNLNVTKPAKPLRIASAIK